MEQQSEIQRNQIVTMEQDLTATSTTMKKEIIEMQGAEGLHTLAQKEVDEMTASSLRQSQRWVTVQQTAAATKKKWVAEQKVSKVQINSSIRMPETRGAETNAEAKRKGDEWGFKLIRSEELHQGILGEHVQQIDELEERVGELELDQKGDEPICDEEAYAGKLKEELGTAELHIEELQKTNTRLMMHAQTLTAEAEQRKLENRKVAVELKGALVQHTNTVNEMEARRIQAREQGDEPVESEGMRVTLEKELHTLRKEMEAQGQAWEEERVEVQKEKHACTEQSSEEGLEVETANREQQTIIEELERTIKKQKVNRLSTALGKSDNAETKRLTNAVETLGQSSSDITLEDAEDCALVRVMQQHELDLVISTTNKVTTLQSKVTGQRVETSRLRKKLQQLDPGSYSGEADDLEIECRTDELDLLIGRAGVAEIESNTIKMVEEFKELVQKDGTEARQTLQMGHAVIKSFAGNQSVDQVQPQQCIWNALLSRATEEGLVTTGVSKKSRTAAKKGQTNVLSLNLRIEGAVYKLVMGMKKKDYALQHGVHIIAVLKNQLATGLVVPITGSLSVKKTANLTGQMEQLKARLEAEDIECIQLTEQIEDNIMQAAKVRGSQSVPKANEGPNGVKEAQLVDAMG